VIRAAIVGLGRWGRTLVNSIQGKSSAIRFTAGHTRTRASAEAFCAENGIALKDDLDQILADPADGVLVYCCGPEGLLAAADAALYEAKSGGRSRCCLASAASSLAALHRLQVGIGACAANSVAA